MRDKRGRGAGSWPCLAAVLGLALAATACGPGQWDDLEQIGAAGEGITDGATYSGHPSVGRLIIGGTTLCTATLVGSKTVLTAAHCIKTGQTHVYYSGATAHATASLHPNSGWIGTHEHDIAVVKLSTAPSGVTPSIISEAVPTVGMGITLIGYGETGTGVGDGNVKRIATNTVATVS